MARSDPALPDLPGTPKSVTVKVFGGLRIWRAGHEIDPGPRRNRLVLAEFLAAGGSVVTVADMVDALWSFHPPGSAVNQVHRLVGQLRRTLEPGLSPHSNGRFVVAADGGYRMAVELLDCDLFQFRRLTRDADLLLRAGHSGSAGELYATALELARGPLFGGLDPSAAARPEFQAIEHERVAVALSTAELAAAGGGSSAATTAAVVQVAASTPLNEPLHARLMTLLAAGGRSADGLIVFDQIRKRLADELGVDPGPELRRAHQALLMLDQPSDAPAAPVVDPLVRPAQLPPALPGFVCRAEAQAALDESMSDAADSVGIAVIAGMGGIGKTALAAHWAHRVRDHFPDGQLYVDLRGFDPSGRVLTAATALDMLLEGLGQSLADLAGMDAEGRVARYRSLLAGRRMIVLLDNVIDAEQVRPLIPSAPGCMVLITSRIILTSLVARDGARFVPLGRLTPPAALQILRRRVGGARLDREPQAVDTILDRCDGLPLALTMLGARIATNPGLTIRAVAERLATTDDALDSLSIGVGRDDLRSVFSWSYDALTADAAQLFRALAVHPGPEMSLASISSIAALSTGNALSLIETLISSHLVEEVSVRRYVLHDLLRAFAAAMIDDSGERTAVERRLVDHYAAASRQAYLIWGRPAMCELSQSSVGVTQEIFDNVRQSIDWYIRERAVLAAVTDLALSRGWNRQAIVMVLDQRPANQGAEPLTASLPQTLRVLEVARGNGDKSLEAELERDAGARTRHDPDTSEAHGQRALRLFVEADDPVGEADTYRNLSNTASLHGRHSAAIDFARSGLSAAKRARRSDTEALLLVAMTASLLESREWQEIIAVGTRALDIISRCGIAYLRSTLLCNMAEAHLHLGMLQASADAAASALEEEQSFPGPRCDRYGMLAILAKSAVGCGRLGAAVGACDQFEAMMDSAKHRSEDHEYLRSDSGKRYAGWVKEARSAMLRASAGTPGAPGAPDRFRIDRVDRERVAVSRAAC